MKALYLQHKKKKKSIWKLLFSDLLLARSYIKILHKSLLILE